MNDLPGLLALAFAVVAVGCGSESDSLPSNAPDAPSVEFLDLRVELLEPRRVVVAFETSVPTSCEVEFGTSPEELTLRAEDPDMEEGELSIEHEVPLEDLEPETTYFWRGFTIDGDENEFRSEIQQFTTPSGGSSPQLTNFALTPVIVGVSSNFGSAQNDQTWGVLNAFDGQMSTEWATQGDGDDARVTIDLGQVRTVTHFAFRSRKMSDGSSIIEAVQFRADDGALQGPFETPDPDQRYLFELDQPVVGQQFVIEAAATTGGNTGAKEIELLGPAR